MKEWHRSFWQEHPALGLGISALLGAFTALQGLALIWLPLLWIAYSFLVSRTILHSVITAALILYTHLLYGVMPPTGAVQAIFSIHSVQKRASPFGSGWLYRGTLYAVRNGEDTRSVCVPCTAVYSGTYHDRSETWDLERAKAPGFDDRNSPHISNIGRVTIVESRELSRSSKSKFLTDRGIERPVANRSYLISGELQKRGEYDFSIKPQDWQPLESTWSLAEMRFKAKEKIKTILQARLHRDCSDLLSALFTGDVEDRMLRYEFGRLGLQHILAISGFHFAIVAAFAAFLLKFILPLRLRLWAMLIVAGLYFLFVGNSPPVQRSWLAISFYLIGQLIHRRTSGLNLLGTGLLIELMVDPLAVQQIGFQLSFLSCFGILMFYHPIFSLLQRWFLIRNLREVAQLSPLEQPIYLFSTFFHRSLSMTLAVNFALILPLLYHFHRFPCLSLLYNLFIPFVAGISMFLLLLSLAIHALLPLFSVPFFWLTDGFTREWLDLVAEAPTLLDFVWVCSVPGWVIPIYLGALWLIAMAKPVYRDKIMRGRTVFAYGRPPN